MNRYTLALRPPAGEGTLVVAYVGPHGEWTTLVELLWNHGYRPEANDGEVVVDVLDDGGGA